MGAQLWDSEAADLRGVHPLQNGGGQPGGVLHVAVGGDAVVGMDVTHRDADDDDGHALVGQMDGRAVGRAAGAHALLHGDAQLLRQIQGIALEAGVGDHAGIDVAQHGPLVDGGLYHIGFGHGVVGGASLKDDGQVGLYGVGGDSGAAGPHFLLDGERAGHVHIQRLVPQIV